jgi:serine protease Do
MEVVRQLKETGRVSRGWLGVVIQEVNRDLAETFGLDRPHGALVTQVLEDSPAEAAGLEPGDIITRFDDEPIEFSSDLPHVVGRTTVGEETSLRIVRNGDEMTLAVTVGELAEREDQQLGFSRSGESSSSRVGLRVESLADAAAERLGIAGGVRVVGAEGPAAEAGISRGDVITRLNNREVVDIASFRQVVDELPAGRSVPVLIIRGEAPRFLALRVPE